jgi:hypothetical protein
MTIEKSQINYYGDNLERTRVEHSLGSHQMLLHKAVSPLVKFVIATVGGFEPQT